MVPAAQALVEDVAVTDSRLLFVPGLGLVTRVQAVPFHRSVSVAFPVSVPTEPTAHALVADVATTEESAVSVPGLGLRTIGPGGAVPVLGERGASVPDQKRSSREPDRPYVGCRPGGDRLEDGAAARIRAGHDGPGGAVPVLGERPGTGPVP